MQRLYEAIRISLCNAELSNLIPIMYLSQLLHDAMILCFRLLVDKKYHLIAILSGFKLAIIYFHMRTDAAFDALIQIFSGAQMKFFTCFFHVIIVLAQRRVFNDKLLCTIKSDQALQWERHVLLG